MVKKKKKEIDKYINTIKDKIKDHCLDLPYLLNDNHVNINTNSWFDIKKYDLYFPEDKPDNIKNNIKFKKEKIIKCQKVKMILNREQKEILHKWFDAYTKMYNEAIKYIKSNYLFTKHNITRDIVNNNYEDVKKIYNFYDIRKELKDKKEIIKEDSQLKNINKNTKFQSHNLDYAIRQLCSNIESAKTNLIRGNIKKFRIKYWRNDRISKTIEIEKCYILKDKICPLLLGDIRYYYNGKEVNLVDIDSNVKINYNKIIDEYTLLIPIKTTNQTISNKTSNLISLDPGLRTFMTGISEDGSLKVGNNVNSIISKSIKRLNKIKNNENIKNKIKKKNELLINRKIKNRIDDLHWKTIKYLTHNYKTILIGDMSAKNIVKQNSSVLSNVQKVACLRTKYYEFTQRLQFKCLMYNVNYKLVNESYTSKICSSCGSYNKDLGGAKVYYCKCCQLNIDRDINGARNIYIKNLI